MFGQRVRQARQARGLTQSELAARAGVSRQLVGTVENGRHLPRVDAALALAAALGETVESLHGSRDDTVEAVVGALPGDGMPVRAGRVGDQLVCAPMQPAFDGWGIADGTVSHGTVQLLDEARPGTVVVGCDPALGLAARILSDRSSESVLAVGASTAEAVTALTNGRTHACVVHGPEGGLPPSDHGVARWHLARWRVGLGAPSDLGTGWIQRALAGRGAVVQRRSGAGSQAAFERAVQAQGGTVPEGPLVDGHVEAAWLAARMGLPAVTIEPTARSAGLAFHPLEDHVAQLWVARDWVDEPGVRRLGDVLTSPGFARRLDAVGGYDLAGCGTPLAAG